ncbi:AEC family transporter [Neisseria animalis]|uniref:AEC family transporter n=1 Tax=Neisseria animalis TaxID=492 RepID=A0A5P3MQ15_NEIAN|nr:AEC family transporter [Neisseria animalis]QEY23667.1 AEC family transporter [Neisseria animalis]ROW32811.1 AEC family transporter [Neisseria animalis]VEE09453.1 Membrane transport protein [Neisseria animalis]
METAFLLAGKIAELTLIVLMGFTLVKLKLLKSEQSYPLSVIALYLISPSVMLHAFQTDYSPEIADGLWLSLKLAVLFHIVLILLGRLLKALFRLDALEQAAMVYTNSGNLIIPLVAAIFGPKMVIYTSGFIIVQMFLFWTHLRILLCGSGKLSWKTVLTNINILAMLAGAAMFVLHIKLPAAIDGALATVGSMIGPVAMLVAGMLIASLPLKSIALSGRIYLIALLRLAVIPLLLLLLLKAGGFADGSELHSTVVLISFLAAISPAAATVTQMALVYGQNADKASAIYGVTTLLCVITMPLMIALYQWIM